ncbi:uncharacterized protein [Gossypium hirsutum]|uniref:Retrotransposon gag protein n=1 Tax=Gossypium hirsutum TaxID=3635 RepID=A0ABM3BWF9_GOSHI|nr:uncharacterized protein LOC107963114 [Gossypium hirsutum]
MGDNLTNPLVPDLDMVEKEDLKAEAARQLDERCRWLEEKFKALEGTGNNHGVDAKDLSLVPNLLLPHKFKMPEFEKYNGTTCPEAHITMFCRRMMGYVNNDQLLIHCFQDSLIGAAARCTTKSFADIVMAGEMIENAIRGGRIEGGVPKRSAPRRKDNEVNNTSDFNSKAVTVSQPKVATVGQQGSQKQESNTRHERMQFTPIPVTYRELYQILYDAHAIAPFHLKPLQPPYPKWYDANARCEYHAGISGHSIENCTGFKKAVERLIKNGVLKFESTSNTENPLPNHDNQGVNAIGEAGGKREKENVDEIRMPMKEFKALVQGFIDNKELQIYEGSSSEKQVCMLENEQQRTSRPRIIISLPGNNEMGTPAASKVIIHTPTPFPYKDSKKVPWSYDYSVTVPGEGNIVSASKDVRDEGSHMRSGKRYDMGDVRVEPTKLKNVEIEKKSEVPVNEPVREEEAKEFLNSEVHREALLKVLNETYVTHDISVNKLDRLINNISADNFIYFNDDEIPPGGIGSTKALHITTRCKGYTLPSVLVDNGSALNVLPLSTLNRLPIDRAVPSSLHQKLKLVTDGRLITINAEDDIIAAVTSKPPYVEKNEKAIECSFRSLEIVNATFILEGSEVLVPRMSRATRMAL